MVLVVCGLVGPEADLDAAAPLVAAGERSLQRCPDRTTATLIDEAIWSLAGGAEVLADADCPDDLDRLGVRWRQGRTEAVGG